MPIGVAQRAGGSASGGSAGATSIAATFGGGTGSGSLIVALFGNQVATNFSSIGDSAGNSYVQAGSEFKPSGINNYFNCYYCNNAIAGAGTVTVTLLASSTYRSLVIYEVTGQDTGTVLNTTATGEGSSTAIAAGSITPAAAAELLVAMMISGGPPITGPGGSWAFANFAVSGDANAYFGDEYLRITSATAATATSTSSAAWGIFAASFKEAGGAPAGPTYPQLERGRDRGSNRGRNMGIARSWVKPGRIFVPAYRPVFAEAA